MNAASPLGEYAEIAQEMRARCRHARPEIGDVSSDEALMLRAAAAIEAMARDLAEVRAEARNADGDLYRDLWKASSKNVGRVCGTANRLRDQRDEAMAALREKDERVKALEEALRPFAEKAGAYDGVPPPKYFGDTDFEHSYSSDHKAVVTVGDLRRARSVLARKEEDGR